MNTLAIQQNFNFIFPVYKHMIIQYNHKLSDHDKLLGPDFNHFNT